MYNNLKFIKELKRSTETIKSSENNERILHDIRSAIVFLDMMF